MTKKYSLEQIIEEAKESNVEVLSDVYLNISTPLQLKCKCGEIFERRYSGIRRDGYLCTTCKSINRLITKMEKLNCFYISHGYFVKNRAWNTYFTFRCSCGEIETKMISAIIKNPQCKECTKKRLLASGCYKSGDEHHSWKGGITPQEDKFRHSEKYFNWRKSVLKRDDYTCQCCELRGKTLHVHHILSYSNHQELRTEVSNGISLCRACHDTRIKGSFHNTYGTRNASPEQLQEYFNNKRSILNLELISIKDIVE